MRPGPDGPAHRRILVTRLYAKQCGAVARAWSPRRGATAPAAPPTPRVYSEATTGLRITSRFSALLRAADAVQLNEPVTTVSPSMFATSSCMSPRVRSTSTNNPAASSQATAARSLRSFASSQRSTITRTSTPRRLALASASHDLARRDRVDLNADGWPRAADGPGQLRERVAAAGQRRPKYASIGVGANAYPWAGGFRGRYVR
jgi:hypothetical protein